MSKKHGKRRENARRVARAALSLFFPCFLLGASEASAEIVFFNTGRTMSVRAHRIEGEMFVFALRDGGEVTCPQSMVARITPDEVPYPDEAAVAAEIAVAPQPAPPGAAALLASRPFADLISTVSATYGVDPRLVHAIVEVESRYQPRARSSKGAKGLMQLMPGTARQYAVRDPYDPKTNLDAGVRHLKDLLSRFDLSLAVAAYNAGEAVVRQHGGIPPFAETRSYVRQVLALVGR